jgi:hypothetical protein
MREGMSDGKTAEASINVELVNRQPTSPHARGKLQVGDPSTALHLL